MTEIAKSDPYSVEIDCPPDPPQKPGWWDPNARGHRDRVRRWRRFSTPLGVVFSAAAALLFIGVTNGRIDDNLSLACVMTALAVVAFVPETVWRRRQFCESCGAAIGVGSPRPWCPACDRLADAAAIHGGTPGALDTRDCAQVCDPHLKLCKLVTDFILLDTVDRSELHIFRRNDELAIDVHLRSKVHELVPAPGHITVPTVETWQAIAGLSLDNKERQTASLDVTDRNGRRFSGLLEIDPTPGRESIWVRFTARDAESWDAGRGSRPDDAGAKEQPPSDEQDSGPLNAAA